VISSIALGKGHRFNSKVLRAADIRGAVGETLSEVDAYVVGRSFATPIGRGDSRVVVGHDGRLSSPSFEAALVDGLIAGGAEVLRVGLGPTSMVYYATEELAANGGIMVTASHNPDPDNGFKIVRRGRPFSVDGDGDRIGAVDGAGRIVYADELLMLLTEPVLAARPGATIIADVKASDAFFDRVRELGGVPLMWRTGNNHIRAKMRETGAPLAGELSGHIFFAHDYYGFDDALYAAVKLIEASSAANGVLTGRRAPNARLATPEIRLVTAQVCRTAELEDILERLQASNRQLDRLDGIRLRPRMAGGFCASPKPRRFWRSGLRQRATPGFGARSPKWKHSSPWLASRPTCPMHSNTELVATVLHIRLV